MTLIVRIGSPVRRSGEMRERRECLTSSEKVARVVGRGGKGMSAPSMVGKGGRGSGGLTRPISKGVSGKDTYFGIAEGRVLVWRTVGKRGGLKFGHVGGSTKEVVRPGEKMWGSGTMCRPALRGRKLRVWTRVGGVKSPRKGKEVPRDVRQKGLDQGGTSETTERGDRQLLSGGGRGGISGTGMSSGPGRT